MKFSCGRCGKKYATAETPAPGRVYKIKCKACGHLIVVKASAAAQQTATTELRSSTSTELAAVAPGQPAGGDGPGLNLEIAAPEPHAGAALASPGLEPLPPEPPPAAFVETPAPTPVNGARTNGAPAGIPQHPDETQEISVASLQPAATPPPVPSADGYVDLFGGAEPPRAEVSPPPEPPPPPEAPPPPPPVEDPFLAAARASLPDGYGKTAGAPDPFAPLKTPPPEPLPSAASAAPKGPVIAKPAQEKSSAPFVLIGVGGLVLVGILAFVLLGGQKPPAPPAPPPAVAVAPAPAPVAPPPPAPAPAPAAQPAPPPVEAAPAPARAERPEKRAAADEDRRAREERRAQEREAKAAREREAKEAREREKAAREAKAREDRDAREREKARVRAEREASARDRERQEQEKVAAAGLGEAEGGLSQDQVQKVLSSTRKAFESCIVNAGKSGAVQLDGRRVMLRLNIQTNGAVTYPTLDDVTLNGTDLGSCLKSAARLMVFPKFKGDTMHVEVPLVLAGGR